MAMVSTEVNWDDVARFVAEYMSRTGGSTGSGDLLGEIAEAYVKARGLPSSAIVTVVQMVDSVL
jgi:hypothetical protein